MSDFVVTRDAMRPASDKERCFYCHEPIGGTHLDAGVLVKKRVKVRATVEYEIEAPAAWTDKDIEFHRNESSWCANNLIGELERLRCAATGCLCDCTEFTYSGGDSEPFLEEK